MLNISNELKTKLIEAKSAEEVAEVLQAAGQVATAEEAAHLWEINGGRGQRLLGHGQMRSFAGHL